MATNEKRLILIDGHALAYRMFFAIQAQMSTRSGEPTNATYGFTRALINLITAEKPPEYLAVAFDAGLSFRDELFEEYKGTREKMPDSLRIQIDRIQQVCRAFNIPLLMLENYEADDLLGTAAEMVGSQGVETTIITGDKDLLQLVNEHTLVQLPGRRSNEDEVYDIDAVIERFGVRPDQFVDFKALVGDTSDNIPGVSGIGDKTATALLNEWETLDNIYAHLDDITPTRARNALDGSKEIAYLSRELSEIKRDVPFDFTLESCRTQDYDRVQVVELFRELEFRSFASLLPGLEEAAVAVPGSGQQLPLFGGGATAAVNISGEVVTETIVVQDAETLRAMVQKLEVADGIAFDTETTSVDQMQADLVGISLAVEPGVGYYIPVGHNVDADKQLPLETVLDSLRPAMTDPSIPKYGHNIKYDAVMLKRYGLEVFPLSFDTMIGEFVLNPGGAGRKLGLKDVAFVRLGVEMTRIEKLLGTGRKQITMDLVEIDRAAPYAAADADMTLQLVPPIRADLEEIEQEDLFYDVEMPLVPVLVDMEMHGVLIDADFLIQLSAELVETLGRRSQQIYDIAGYEFNMNSPQQLSEALFDKVRLPTEGLRKTKSGFYSTAADVLDSLLEKDTTGIVEAILEFRELEKLRGTYVDALPQMVNPKTGRIHTSFNQTGAVTGRISSSDPNLQNIPIRTDMGRRVREAFIAPPGYKLLAADYSQVELRVMAHISGDEALRQAFIEDQDIHATTAAAVFGVPLEAVSHAQRSFAKAVNFGLLYGMGAFRLARDSELTLAESEAFIKTYFERFPRVQQYLEETRKKAEEQGYVETLLGRRRYFPVFQREARSQQDHIERRAAEREAVNMPIQGTAADIIKIAMINLHQALREQGLAGRMILQVHDELVLEVPDAEVKATEQLVREVMQNAYPMDVPLKVDAHAGDNWGELK